MRRLGDRATLLVLKVTDFRAIPTDPVLPIGTVLLPDSPLTLTTKSSELLAN